MTYINYVHAAGVVKKIEVNLPMGEDMDICVFDLQLAPEGNSLVLPESSALHIVVRAVGALARLAKKGLRRGSMCVVWGKLVRGHITRYLPPENCIAYVKASKIGFYDEKA